MIIIIMLLFLIIITIVIVIIFVAIITSATYYTQHEGFTYSFILYSRFVAPPQNSIDTINIIAEDECGKRAQFTITIETGRCKCHHNGICRPTEKYPRGRGHYRCLCKEGYSGTLCEHLVTSL